MDRDGNATEEPLLGNDVCSMSQRGIKRAKTERMDGRSERVGGRSEEQPRQRGAVDKRTCFEDGDSL
jgi:hypothetical protein